MKSHYYVLKTPYGLYYSELGDHRVVVWSGELSGAKIFHSPLPLDALYWKDFDEIPEGERGRDLTRIEVRPVEVRAIAAAKDDQKKDWRSMTPTATPIIK